MPLLVPEAPFPFLDGSQSCAQTDPDLFFPRDGDAGAAAVARRVCASCPLVRACLAYALTHAVDGVWGATTPKEREALRRRHGLGRPTYRSPVPKPRPPSDLEQGGSDEDRAG